MKAATKAEKDLERGFDEKYRSALRAYAAHRSEEGLIRAYELGREAMGSGKSLVEVASIHQEAVLELFNDARGARRGWETLRASASFLAESLSPFEMAHRGFQDAVKTLRQLNETLEEEIKRIAHAVHDDAGQLLVAVHLGLADVSRKLPKPQQEQLERVGQLLHEVENQLRRYSHELRPTILDDLGWIPAIRFLVDGVTKRANLPIQIKTTFDGRLPSAIEIALYRAVQEALTNATKHARASRVLIHVRRAGHMVSCSIRDDGTGFDVRAAQSGRRRSGLGLIGMRERLSAVGGTLSIDSAPGQGTHILLRVPAPQEGSGGNSRSARR